MKCAAYIFTDNETSANNYLNKQKEMIKAYISERDWQLNCVYSDVNSEESLNLMIEDANQGKFDIILTVNPLRLLRNHEQSMKLVNLIKINAVNISTTDHEINTFYDDITTLNLYRQLSETEVDILNQKIKATSNK